MRILVLLVFFPVLALAQPEPEPASAWLPKDAAYGESYMAVTAHPLATEAAIEMLEQGGSAVDAAIAAQLMLGLVEPQSSGIGGGGFMLHYDARTADIISYDGRETAPAAATPDRFLDAEGNPMPFMEAVRSPKAVGVPGLVAMLGHAHKKHGKLPWAELFKPAIAYAEGGFRVSPRMYNAIADAITHDVSDSFRGVYLNSLGQPRPTDTIFTNPDYAQSLKVLAKNGAKHFYTRAFAQPIIDALHAQGGDMVLDDIRTYKPLERPVACGQYRTHTVCAMDAPSSGLTLLQTLGVLEHFSLDHPNDTAHIHTVLEAQKRAFADRNHYIADPAFTQVPYALMLSPRYLKLRADEITDKASPKAEAGEFSALYGMDNSVDMPSTSHISILDADGNAVSLTSSVEHNFGSSIVVGGFVLNNQLTDFAFSPTDEAGKPVANAVAAGKRPRSSMVPTMVFSKNGNLQAILGSPGGSSIIPYVTKTLIALIDWKYPLQAALNAPHFMHKNGDAVLLESDTSLASPLRALGHVVEERPMSSGLHAIMIDSDGNIVGAADPRREGVARGR